MNKTKNKNSKKTDKINWLFENRSKFHTKSVSWLIDFRKQFSSINIFVVVQICKGKFNDWPKSKHTKQLSFVSKKSPPKINYTNLCTSSIRWNLFPRTFNVSWWWQTRICNFNSHQTHKTDFTATATVQRPKPSIRMLLWKFLWRLETNSC